jgi:uncharacterized protein YceK
MSNCTRTVTLVIAVILSGCSGLTTVPSPGVASGARTASPAATHDAYAAWSRAVRHVPLPSAGCFKASYPSMAWTRIECSKPNSIRPESVPAITSNGDYSADVSPHTIASATGSFPAVIGVTSVSSTNAGSDSGNGSYSLQLNSQFFSTAACGTLAHCQGWVQFVYRNQTKRRRSNLEIWDWLVSSTSKPLASCPLNAGWDSSASGSGVDCYQTSPIVWISNQPITNLANMTLTGSASSTGDSIELSTGSTVYAVQKAQPDSVLDLSSHWNFAEFNVFGYSTAGSKPSSAQFNAGSNVTVSVEVDDGVMTRPRCIGKYSTTLEINNLSLSAPPPSPTPLANPSIIFAESNPGSGTASCTRLAGENSGT